MGKIGKGHPIRSQTSEVILNVKEYFEKENLEGRTGSPFPQVQRRVSEATGIGLNTVQRICQDAEFALATGQPFPKATPGKKRPRAKKVSDPDNFALEAIRRRVHRFYLDGELPTLSKLRIALEQEHLSDDVNGPPVFDGCNESLRKILTVKLGFKFVKLNRRTHFLERTDVVALRHEFLRKVRNVDFNNIYFLNETWVNENHTVSKCWQSSKCTGINVPTGKGKRLILLHVGSSKGFVEGSLLLFRSKTGKIDYHDDMNAECFTEWFQELIVKLPPNSVIVMDNAPYHSVKLHKAPTSQDRKKTMQDWLLKNDIPFEPCMLKAQLYELIKLHKPALTKYVIDEMAAAAPYGHRVIRLPPYHCQFNPIEMVWADVKRYVATRNHKFKMAEVENLTKEAIASIAPVTWKKHVEHVKKDIEEYWVKDGLIECAIEPLIIRVGNDSESEFEECDDFDMSTDEYSDVESSFTPLEY